MCRLSQADAESQSGDGVKSEATSTAGVTVSVSDSNAPKHEIGIVLVLASLFWGFLKHGSLISH